MKDIRKFALLALILPFFGLCAVACAGGPPPQGEPSAEVRVLDRSEIKSSWGSRPTVNPFLEPTGLIQGQPNEFVVIEVKFSLPSRSAFGVDAYAEGADGQEIAWMKDAGEFSDYWSVWEKMGNSSQRGSKIESYYLPGKTFTYPRGTYRYLVALVGKNPLPRPATIRVVVRMTDGIHNWDFPLADKK